MSQRITLLVFAIFSLFALSGCFGPKKKGDVNIYDQNANSVRGIVADPELHESLVIEEVNKTGLSDDDLMTVTLSLRNTTNKAITVVYQFEWFDKNGILINTITSNPEIKTIIPGDVFYLKRVAPALDAYNYSFKLRRK